jgi:hypothetical protein
LIEKEDAAFARTLKGRRQLNIGEIDGIASFQRVREVAAVYNNEIRTNIRDNSTYMKVLSFVKELAPSIHTSSDREKQKFKSRVRHHCSFDCEDHTLANDAEVWILWIRISKYTINDGIRQLISFICCVQEARRRGRNIEIYPIICIAPEYSRHDSPYQNPALHQLLQILCDPYLEGRRVFVVASDSTRFAFHPDDIQRIQRAVNCLHPACELKSLQALHTDIVEHHRLIYQYFKQLKSLGDEFASRLNVMKTLEPLLEHNETQERVFRHSTQLRQELNDRCLRQISKSNCPKEFFYSTIVHEVGCLLLKYTRNISGSDTYSINQAATDLISEVRSKEWSLPKRLRKKSVAAYNRTSGKNGTFLDETPRAEEIMGSDGASLSPLQLMNCLAGIGEVYDVNGMDVISSAAIFNDHCVGRDVVAKPGLCAMLAVCNSLAGIVSAKIFTHSSSDFHTKPS